MSSHRLCCSTAHITTTHVLHHLITIPRQTIHKHAHLQPLTHTNPSIYRTHTPSSIANPSISIHLYPSNTNTIIHRQPTHLHLSNTHIHRSPTPSPPHNHPSPTIYTYQPSNTHPSPRSRVQGARSSVEVANAAFAIRRRVDRVAELVECPRTSDSPRVPLPPASCCAPECPLTTISTHMGTAEYLERCEAFLSAAHLLVQSSHNESLRTATDGLSPRDQALTLQQRAQFLDHIQVSEGQLESLIEHQEALNAIFHGRPLNPHTGLPIVYSTVIPTAHLVPSGLHY